MIPSLSSEQIRRNYDAAREVYSLFGVDVDAALNALDRLSISLHCWQGDDVAGFENPEGELSGGIQATGNYPGKARTPAELRADLEKVYSLLPGKHRLSIHAFYVDYPQKVERNALQPEHFASWMDWSAQAGVPLDFNSTFFSHPLAADGYTLSHPDQAVRDYWVEHLIACRQISEAMGKRQGSPCVHNVWIPDGEKDTPADRWAPRARLLDSLDRAFAQPLDPRLTLEAVESKLFGIGSESYVVGSLEFYTAYAVSRKKLLTLDMGHFHPTEVVSEKISAVLQYIEAVLLHVSRGIRWDSDHVVTLTDEVKAICDEVVRGNALERVFFGLDFFDASINRIAAWVVGARALQKALLISLLTPHQMLKDAEAAGDRSARLALMEDFKNLPFGAIWDFYCEKWNVPAGAAWLNEVRAYEQKILAQRS